MIILVHHTGSKHRAVEREDMKVGRREQEGEKRGGGWGERGGVGGGRSSRRKKNQ